MIAIGELQKEMGPDMRVSAESALFDTEPGHRGRSKASNQSHWLASYNAWGDWLNASYTAPGLGRPSTSPHTYTPKRRKHVPPLAAFGAGWHGKRRRCPDLPYPAWNDTNSVKLVGKGSLGIDEAATDDDSRRKNV